MKDLSSRLSRARTSSWKHFGKKITFYLPGMFTLDGFSGKYPAASITGKDCALQCDHCRGKILAPMIQAETPNALVDKCLALSKKGNIGVLISGGADANGCLPWEKFIPAIREIKQTTHLYVSIHSGFINTKDAVRLKQAGVDQALIDVIGDDDTLKKIYHLPFGVARIASAMESLQSAGIPIVPHIVCGLNNGRINGEKEAVAVISRFKVDQVVIVSLMAIPGTPVWGSASPAPEDVADIIAEARFKIPNTLISLGCARQRGNSRMETMAIDAGVNRLALPSEQAIERALGYGLELRYQKTCCSVAHDLSDTHW